MLVMQPPVELFLADREREIVGVRVELTAQRQRKSLERGLGLYQRLVQLVAGLGSPVLRRADRLP